MPKGKPNKAAKAKKANKPEPEGTKMIDHVVTEEDLKANPELIEKGVIVGETIQIPEDAVVEEETEEYEEEEEEESNEDEASVYKENGEFVRAYSKEVHGKDFKKLAEEFAGKIGGSVK